MRVRFLFPLACLALAGLGCGDKRPHVEPPTHAETGGGTSASTQPKPKNPLGTLKELKTMDEVVGKGQTAEQGDLVTVLYTGTLADGEMFDSNMDGGAPLAFQLGSGFVIKGWELGLKGMKVGGRRKISIPYALAYNMEGSPPKIPPMADLYFDVKLLDVVKKGEEQVYDKRDHKVGSGVGAKNGDTVTIHYVGHLVNGVEFDSSRGRGEPLSFTVGAGKVVPGLDAGIVGMRTGGVRELILPPELAYGARGNLPSIPPNAKLKFKLEMLKIQPGG